MSADLLRMEYINSLPQPLVARRYGSWWGVHDIEVETGLVRIDVCGMIDVWHITDVRMFRDDCGDEHEPDSFYTVDAAKGDV